MDANLIEQYSIGVGEGPVPRFREKHKTEAQIPSPGSQWDGHGRKMKETV
jgi:hypothetical protein